MRLLYVHDMSQESVELQRSLASHAELRTFNSLGDAIGEVATGTWQPDIVVLEFQGEAVLDLSLLGCLRDIVAKKPIIIGAANAVPFLQAAARMPALEPARLDRKIELVAVVESLIEQQRMLSEAVIGRQLQMTVEAERAATLAVEVELERAMGRLAAKLGVGDVEGLRLAANLARRWDAAKRKLLATLTTGLVASLLLGLGAAIAAILRNSTAK